MGFLNAPGKLLNKVPGVPTLNKPVNSVLGATPGLRGVSQQVGMNGPASKQPAPSPQESLANSQGQGFAQQNPAPQVNPMMGARPPMQGINQNAGMAGSRSMIQAKQQELRNKMSGTIGGSYNQMLGARPELQDYRNSGQQAGQDMSWMDKPGALTMGPPPPVQSNEPQSGLANLQTPYDQQQSEMNRQEPNQTEQQIMQNKMAAGPIDMGAASDAGIGPSNPAQMMGYAPGTVMDENGLEPRRGPR
jgi:hypothetical protein